MITRTAALELLLSINPLHMRFHGESLVTIYRLKYVIRWSPRSNFLSWKNLNSEILYHHFFFCMRKYLLGSSSISHSMLFWHLGMSGNPFPSSPRASVDGSKMRTGADAVFYNHAEDGKFSWRNLRDLPRWILCHPRVLYILLQVHTY